MIVSYQKVAIYPWLFLFHYFLNSSILTGWSIPVSWNPLPQYGSPCHQFSLSYSHLFYRVLTPLNPLSVVIRVAQFSCSVVSDSLTPWTKAQQASLSITNSWSLLRLMSIELVMASNHLILSHHLLLPPSVFPSIRVFSMRQFSASGDQSIGVSASTSVLSMNTQDWSPLGWTGWISLQSKGLSRVFSNTTVQKHQFFSNQLSL